MNIVENEITALTHSRSNASIINLYEVFYDRGETILVLEYATEKDLHLYLDCEGAFEEAKACNIIYQILKAIEFLHTKNILHLDIKPENVLLMSPLTSAEQANNDDEEKENKFKHEDTTAAEQQMIVSSTLNSNIHVKLCDFSFSQIMVPGKHILGMMGTVAYSAPEVLQYEPLTKATDMWSLGVVAHVLLTEYTPFGNGTEENHQTQTNILNVRERDFKCTEDYFEDISDEAKDFVESLLKYRPKNRLTIEEALNHKWFKSLRNKTETCTENVESSQTINLTSVTNKSNENNSTNSEEKTTKIVEIKDDKNNNSLSSIIETLQITNKKSNNCKSDVSSSRSSSSNGCDESGGNKTATTTTSSVLKTLNNTTSSGDDLKSTNVSRREEEEVEEEEVIVVNGEVVIDGDVEENADNKSMTTTTSNKNNTNSSSNRGKHFSSSIITVHRETTKRPSSKKKKQK